MNHKFFCMCVCVVARETEKAEGWYLSKHTTKSKDCASLY